MGAFLNNPGLRRLMVGDEGFNPDRPWVLLGALKYYSGILGRTVVVPKGYQTDFASIPWVFRRWFPQDGLWTHAAIVHDFMCDRDHESNSVISLVFLEALKDLRVPFYQAYPMYWAVLLFRKLSRRFT
jgi:hypothetical protein